jgi:DNA repair exonuclease SbcCD ATPase subunit
MAEQIKKEVIVDVVVKSDEAIANIAEAKREIAALQAKNKELTQSEEDQSEAIAANVEQIKALNKVIAANSKEIQTNIQQQKAQEGSLNQMRAELKDLTTQYDNLSRAERQSAKGTEMLNKIQGLTQQLMLAEEESGRFQRNVGNYPGVMGQAGSAAQKLAATVNGITGGAKNLGTAFTNAGKTVASFGRQLLKLLANPIVAIIAAIAVVVMKLVSAFKKNDEAMTSLQRAFASFQPILDAVNKAFSVLATVIGKVVEVAAKAMTAILNLIPGFRDAADEARELVDAQDALEEKEREYTVQSAKNQREIARIRDEAADKAGKTAQERAKLLKQAMDLEEQDVKTAKEIAEEKVRLYKEQIRQQADTSDEAMNQLAQLEAAAIQADTEYYKAHRKLQKEYASSIAEMQKEEEEQRKKAKEAAKKAAEDRKQRQATELKERRAAEDLAYAVMKDSVQKQELIIRAANARAIEDLKLRLVNEKNLTKEAREAINRQIILLQAQLQVQLLELSEQTSQKEFARLTADYQRRLELVGNDYDEKFRLQKAQLERERQQAIAAAVKTGVDTAAIYEYYDKEIADAKAATEKAKWEAVKQQADTAAMEEQNRLNHALEEVAGNEQAKLQLQADYAQRRLAVLKGEYDEIAALNEQDAITRYGSIEAWKQAQLQADNAVIEANRQVRESAAAVSEAQYQSAMNIANSFQQVGGTIQGLFDTLAETDDRYADFATAMAMANIITSTAISIANAIQGATAAAAATGPGAPIATPIFIAEMVAIVMGGITSAIATLNKAKQAQAQAKFAEGGLVEGPGTGTSDSIPARLSNGEFVMNAESTKKYLPQLLAMNGGWGNTSRGGMFAAGGVARIDDIMRGYQTDNIRAAFAEAVASVQPVVSVKEITRVQNRVATKELIAKS